jgi:sulfite exporter TauE/SafE
MINEAHFTAGLVTGFLGSAHCVGMCGPLVAALSLAGKRGNSGSGHGLAFHLFYNLGRTATYTLLGLLTGLAGSMIFLKSDLALATRVLLITTDLLVIAVGLNVLGVVGKLNIMNMKSEAIVRPFAFVAAKTAALETPLTGLPAGVVFGLIPCGFTYAMLMVAAQSADPARGAMTMLGFGLGTAPAVFMSGGFAHLLRGRAGHWMVRLAGLMIALLGGYHLYKHLMPLVMACTTGSTECCAG